MIEVPANARARLAWVTIVPTAAAAGALLPVNPVAALLTAAFAISLALLAVGRGVAGLFLTTITVLLVGYMFMGRGFAYLGMPPLYVGEIALALGGFALLTALPVRRLGAGQLLVVAFMAWGAIRTFPYLATYGIDALRDASVWVYALFAIVLSILLQPRHMGRVVSLYGKLVPLFIPWVPILAIVWVALPGFLLSVPGSGVAIPFFKPGDMAVHLAGAAAFVLAGLYPAGGWRALTQPLLWAIWLIGVAVVASTSRGGMLAVSTISTLVFFRRSLARWGTALLVGLLMLGFAGITDLESDTGGARSISLRQVTENALSIIGESDNPALTGSREWREEWWESIIGYTVGGPLFWEGKGYGIDLAEADGFQVGDRSLRAPHNAHLNLLARGGVPGLALWISVQVAFAATLLRAAHTARRSARPRWSGLLGWIFVYWLAALVNMSFDVYLEGPQGGIVYWSLIGLGLAAAYHVHHTRDDVPLPDPSVERRGRLSARPAYTSPRVMPGQSVSAAGE